MERYALARSRRWETLDRSGRWRVHDVAQVEERLALGDAYMDSGDLVFTHEDGSPIHPERFTRWFRQLCTRSGGALDS